MIPVLYSATETEFKTNGLGALYDAISCEVSQEVNGMYELTMKYPVKGLHFSDIARRVIIKAKPDPVTDPQPFRVYRITKPVNGIVTVYARHLVYDLAGIPVSPFSATGAPAALQGLKNNAAIACPFTFETEKTDGGTMEVVAPASLWSKLGGTEGSILDIYGGEYSYDAYRVTLHKRRGADRGVAIRYGKNLTDLEQDENCANCYTGVYPYWFVENELVTLPEKILHAEGNFGYTRILPLDLTDRFEEKPEVAALRSVATKYMVDNEIGVPAVSWKVEFVALEQTEEYKGQGFLERISLGDTVLVEFDELGVNASARAVKTVYNVLCDRYENITLGRVKANLAQTIVDQNKEIAKKPNKTLAEKISSALAAAILGANGGAVRLLDTNYDGCPDTLYIADHPDPAQAVKVWRYNYEGWAASKNGYNGPFVLGATLDDGLLSNFVTAANLVAGTIQSQDGKTFFLDLDNGVLRMQATELSISGKTVDEIAQGKADAAQAAAQKAASTELNNYAATVTQDIIDLQNQIDGNITTWFDSYIPTASNAPASSWTTTALKNQHLGDLFYIVNNSSYGGRVYRWTVSGSTYSWQLVEDTDVTKALAAAAKAQDTADGKRRVFVSTPTPPYDVGDLWSQGGSGDLMRCKVGRASGSYVASDWELASKYIDAASAGTIAQSKADAAQAAAQAAAHAELNDYAATVTQNIANLQNQIDGNITTWFDSYIPTVSNAPASSWTTTALKNQHLGDLFYIVNNSSYGGRVYRWTVSGSTYSWQLVEDTDVTKALAAAAKAQDTADGKRRVFVSTPTPPYDVGDLWSQGGSGDLMRCKVGRASGSYVASDWELASKYIDAASAGTIAQKKVDGQTQSDIFNKLTNNGVLPGLYMQNGQLYINASYLQTGTINSNLINTLTLFAKNITMTGTFVNTTDAFLEPNQDVLNTINNHLLGISTIPSNRIPLYDFNNSGTITIADLTLCHEAVIGKSSLAGWSGAKRTPVTVTINLSNPARAIVLSGTDMWGGARETVIGVDPSAATFVTKDLLGTIVSMDINGGMTRRIGTETEYINPPMEVGVEYRTAERWQGKAVYVKAINYGSLPNNREGENYALAPGLDVIDIHGFAVGSSYIVPVPGYMGIINAGYTKSTGNLWIATDRDMTGYTAYITVKYTK